MRALKQRHQDTVEDKARHKKAGKEIKMWFLEWRLSHRIQENVLFNWCVCVREVYRPT